MHSQLKRYLCINISDATGFSNFGLDNLINKWCEDKNLRALSFILPAYIGNMGTENDINKLISALSYLSATQWLKEEEQKVVDGLVRGLVN